MVVKQTTQNLIASMKTWVRLPRADPPASADDVSINEKEIASLTVKLSGLAPSLEIKKALVDNIKLLLLRGKIAMQDPSEENLGALTAALKEVAEVLKDFVTGKTAAPVGGSLLRVQTGGRTASSPALNAHNRGGPSGPKGHEAATAPASPAATLSGIGAVSSPAVKRAPVTPMEVLAGSQSSSSPAVTRRNPSLMTSGDGPATPASKRTLLQGEGAMSSPGLMRRSATPDATMSAPALNAPVLESYDDGSPPPPPSQDFATAMWEQRDKFPKLQVPWQLDYLCNQIALRGGGVSVGQFDPILPERKLAPYDITFACGNLSWVSEKDYLIPLSLLKRYLWHMPSATIPDRQEALDKVKDGSYSYEASQYVMDMPLHKRDVVCYLVAYIRKIGEIRGSNDMQDLVRVFAPLIFRSSSNFSTRDNKMKIPPAMAEEVRFVANILRDLDVQAVSKKGDRERARISSRPSTQPLVVPDAGAQRTLLKSWSTENELAPASWLLPTCCRCNQKAPSWVLGSGDCKECNVPYLRSQRSTINNLGRTKFVNGYQHELGLNKVCDTLRDKNLLELVHNQTMWYQDFFYGKPHFNFLVQDKELKDGKAQNVAVVSVLRPPDGYTDPFPVQALVLVPEQGYVRVVVDVAPNKKKVADVKDVLAGVRTLTMVPSDSRIIHSDNQKVCDALADFEQKTVLSNYKFGVLYQGSGQTTEEQMYNNMTGSRDYYEFLDLIGEKVTLAKHKGFRGGLECQGNNSTGEFSVYSKLFCNADGAVINEETEDGLSMEIMWHVATYLPDTGEMQQLQRKRHLGNDLVIIIFSESSEPFDPASFASQFNHVWIVVSVHKSGGYVVSVVTKTGVKPFRPFIPDPALVSKEAFRDWFLLKCVNAERAAYFAKDFKGKEVRTRVKMMESWEASFLEQQQAEKSSWGSSLVSQLSESSSSLFSSLFSGKSE